MGPARKAPDISTYSGRFAVRLRTLREKAGLTVEEVADAIGVSTKTIYGWEASRTKPDVEFYPLLSTAYGLSSPRFILPEK